MKPKGPEEPPVFRTEVKPAEVRDRGQLVDTPRGRLALLADRSPKSPGLSSTVVAVDAWCPHLDGPLWEGSALDGEIACPWHSWRFSLETGRCTWAPAGDAEEAAETEIQVYRTRESADGFVEIIFAPQIRGQVGFD